MQYKNESGIDSDYDLDKVTKIVKEKYSDLLHSADVITDQNDGDRWHLMGFVQEC